MKLTSALRMETLLSGNKLQQIRQLLHALEHLTPLAFTMENATSSEDKMMITINLTTFGNWISHLKPTS
jgi:hypothetical protein